MIFGDDLFQVPDKDPALQDAMMSMLYSIDPRIGARMEEGLEIDNSN